MARPNRPGYFPARRCWRFTFEGKQRYICKGTPPDERPQRDGIPRRVWDEMDRIIRAAEGLAAAAVDPSVYWLAQMFLAWTEAEVEAGRLERSKFVCRRSHCALLLELFPDRDALARLVTVDMADELFARLRGHVLPTTGRPPSPYYVHEVGRTLRAMFRWAARPVRGREPARLIPVDPLDGYSYPPQPGAVRGYVEGDIVRRFLRWAWARSRWADVPRPEDPATGRPILGPAGDAAANLKRRFDRVYVLMLRFGRLTGCRPGEACGLRWEEISPPIPPPGSGSAWRPTTIQVSELRRKTRKQTTRKRVIHLTEPAARLLRALERLPGRNPEYVFPHMRGRGAEGRGFLDPLAGEPWPSGSAASKKVTAWRREAIAAGLVGVEDVGPLKLVAYANRHALASEGSSLGFSDEQIAELMGNTPEVMRKVYAHAVDDVAADTNRRLAELRREINRKRKAKEAGGGQAPAAGGDGAG